jgi:hypothetical protein
MTFGPRLAKVAKATAIVLAAAALASCETSNSERVAESAEHLDGESADYLAVAVCHETGDYAFGAASNYAVAANNAMKDCEAKVQGGFNRFLRDVNPVRQIDHCCQIRAKLADQRGPNCLAVAAATRIGVAAYIGTDAHWGMTAEKAQDRALDRCDRDAAGCRVIETRCRTQSSER